MGMLLVFASNTFADDSYKFRPKAGEAIPFVPFSIEEFCKKTVGGQCTERYQKANELFHDKELYRGTVGEYVDYLNSMEKLYNQSGETLRAQAEDFFEETIQAMEIPTKKTPCHELRYV